MTWEFYVGVGVATTLFTKTKTGCKEKMWEILVQNMGFAENEREDNGEDGICSSPTLTGQREIGNLIFNR